MSITIKELGSVGITAKSTALKTKRAKTSLDLAKAYFIDGLSQQKAVVAILGWSEASANSQAHRVFDDYAVVDTYLKTFPDELDPLDFERLLSMVKQKAVSSSDPKLMLDVVDRIGRATGKLQGDKTIVVGGDVHINQIAKARKILSDKGIDVDQVLGKVG